MGKKKGDWQLVGNISPDKAKFLNLKSPDKRRLVEALKGIDWATERRCFVDVGDGYAYNPRRDFYNKREVFYAATAELAPGLLEELCNEAMASGVSSATVREWAAQQRDRWFKEKKWDRLNG